MKPSAGVPGPLSRVFPCVTGAMLDKIRIPHGQKGTISLVERQLDRQRERIEQLEQEITELSGVASESRSSGSMRISSRGSAAADLVRAERRGMGKAFVQRLRTHRACGSGSIPVRSQLGGPEQRFLAQGKQL